MSQAAGAEAKRGNQEADSRSTHRRCGLREQIRSRGVHCLVGAMRTSLSQAVGLGRSGKGASYSHIAG